MRYVIQSDCLWKIKEFASQLKSRSQWGIDTGKVLLSLGVVLNEKLILARYFSAWESFSMRNWYWQGTYQSAYYATFNYTSCHIRRYLNYDTASMVVISFMKNRTDYCNYCNSLSAVAPRYQIDKQQWEKNAAARYLPELHCLSLLSYRYKRTQTFFDAILVWQIMHSYMFLGGILRHI